jgi:peptidyl-tRNA hydrolase, PTH1 family
MLIIYGLGNNEKQYLNTKHNIGRLVVEEIAAAMQLTFQKKDSFYFAKNTKIILAYSTGYMNHSGKPLQDVINYFKPETVNVLIIQDDSDQISGNFKITAGGGSAGHHGINSIYEQTKSTIKKEETYRLKLGIRPSENREKSISFVLNQISITDKELYINVAKKLQTLIETKKVEPLALLSNKLVF